MSVITHPGQYVCVENGDLLIVPAVGHKEASRLWADARNLLKLGNRHVIELIAPQFLAF